MKQRNPVKKAFAKLESLVDYQEGAVVSRTVIDKKAGKVTVFAFDEGEGLSEHVAPFDALVMCLRAKQRL